MFLFRESRFGGAKRLYYLAKELEKRAELHVLCLDVCHESEAAACFGPEFANLYSIPLDFNEKNGFFSLSLPINLSPKLDKVKATWFPYVDTSFDAVVLAYPAALSFLEKGLVKLPANRLYIEDDLPLETYRKDFASGNPLPKRIYKYLRYLQLYAYYRKRLREVRTFVAISREEEQIVKKDFPGIKTIVMKYGLPKSEIPERMKNAKRARLGFIGNFQHPPNLDAMLWLLESLFPYLHRNHPNLSLIIAGRYIPEHLIQHHAVRDGVEFMESPESLNIFYDNIGIFINPIRTGRGMRTKVVEAAAYGKPIVSTVLGAEGMEDLRIRKVDNEVGILAEVEKLQDPNEWENDSDFNYHRIREFYTQEAMADSLWRGIEPDFPNRQ